jgi:N6-L-threonylcarbamoyladenine synthase
MIAMVAKLKYEKGEFTDLRATATAKYDFKVFL